MTRVSVIIPTHNRAALAREAVDSALRQSGVNVEIIVIDDGSTDHTATELGSFGAAIRLIAQERSGACAARNRGLESASGEFIKFLDSDDLLEPDSLADQVRALEESGAEVGYGLWTEFGEGSDPRGLPPPVMPHADPVDALLADWWAPPCAYLIRAAAARRIVWDPELSSAQDFDYMTRLAISGARFVHVARPVARYRHHASDRVSRRRLDEWAKNRARALQEIRVELETRGALDPTRRRLIALQLFRIAQAVRPADRGLFHRFLSLALDADPAFSPPNRLHALAASAFGFERAERLLVIRRTLRQWL